MKLSSFFKIAGNGVGVSAVALVQQHLLIPTSSGERSHLNKSDKSSRAIATYALLETVATSELGRD